MEFKQEALQAAMIQIAVLETKVEALSRENAELKAMVKTMASKLDTVASTLTEARGGWRALMLLGGAGATFGGVVSWVLQHVPFPGAK